MRSRSASIPRRLPASAQDWFSVVIEIGHDRTVRLVLELDGRIDHGRLLRAFGLLLDAEPILRCRFAASPFHAHWRVRDDLEAASMCRLVLTADVPGDLHAFMAAAIDPERDPLVQVAVFRAETDTVCFKVSHAAMDGGGFKQLVYRLIAAYRDLASEPVLALPGAANAERSQWQVLRLFPFHRRIAAFLTQPFHKKKWSFPYVEQPLSDVTFSTRMSGVNVSAVREAARKLGFNVTDALVAAFARSLFEATDAPVGVPIPFVLPIDLRRHLPDANVAGLCNLSSLSWFSLERRPGADIAQTMGEVHRELEGSLSALPGIGLAVVMEIAALPGYGMFRILNRARARMARAQGREFPSLSNIGPLDQSALDFGEARPRHARFYAPVSFPPTFSVVVGSFEEMLYFTTSYPASVVPGDLMERYLDRLVAEIRSLR